MILGVFEEFSNLNRLNINRGPDANSVINFDINDTQLKIGHTRLSIQDLSNNANQPMASFTGRFIISFNGEIYNHQELRNEFPNYEFSTKSDCEVILALSAKYGANFIDKMNGIFGFVIYDSKTLSITVVLQLTFRKQFTITVVLLLTIPKRLQLLSI